jgi:hypothetical protein
MLYERFPAQVVQYLAAAACSGAFVRGASDRSLRTVVVVQAPPTA